MAYWLKYWLNAWENGGSMVQAIETPVAPWLGHWNIGRFKSQNHQTATVGSMYVTLVKTLSLHLEPRDIFLLFMFSKRSIPVRTVVDLEPILGTVSVRWECTLHGALVNCRTWHIYIHPSFATSPGPGHGSSNPLVHHHVSGSLEKIRGNPQQTGPPELWGSNAMCCTNWRKCWQTQFDFFPPLQLSNIHHQQNN